MRSSIKVYQVLRLMIQLFWYTKCYKHRFTRSELSPGEGCFKRNIKKPWRARSSRFFFYFFFLEASSLHCDVCVGMHSNRIYHLLFTVFRHKYVLPFTLPIAFLNWVTVCTVAISCNIHCKIHCVKISCSVVITRMNSSGPQACVETFTDFAWHTRKQSWCWQLSLPP